MLSVSLNKTFLSLSRYLYVIYIFICSFVHVLLFFPGVAMSKSDDDLGKPDSLILWIVVSVIFVVGTAAVVAVIR